MTEPSPTDPSPRGFVPVCAIGASAGGVAALQTLFRLLPPDLGLAYVVVMHLAPDHPSAMDEILGAVTRMPVHQVADGPKLGPNCVYVIAPDRELVIEGDDVKSRPFTDPRGRRAPIDRFFRSIAAGRGDGIAVVLTGAGSDGAVGVRAIKEAGGLVMVQEPSEAGFPSMPQSAIATGVADVVAPIARLAERIAEAARSKEAVRSLDEDGAANDIRRIVAFLRTRTGHDFSGYKRSTVVRRIARRMQVAQIVAVADYAQHLRDNPEEAKALFADLLISVTQFFRDPDAFDVLTQRVIRPLFERLETEEGGEVRAWVVGCATGEEAYSLAILLLEEAERCRVHAPIQVFATDLDEGALATAREGRYPRSIEADVSPERLKRFFVDEQTHYRISGHVRDLVLFATHSVVREPPFMRLDLVTCRNVLIYLERALQQHVCGIFHYGLKTEGALFLGSAETADASKSQFAVIDRDARIYRALPAGPEFLPSLISPPAAHAGRAAPVGSRPPAARFDAGEVLGASHAAALEASAPPSALVDADHGVLHLSPTAGRFVALSAGPLSGRLPSIVRPELRLDLKLALDRVFESGQPTVTRLIEVAVEGAARRVSLHIAPVPVEEGAAPRAVVFFLDNGPARTSDEAEPALPAGELQHLHSELKAAQEAELAGRLRHESAMQELRASNEELQSLNEEYRSTAEELETSKEELQSINEELQTVNAELKSKLAVISSAHNDLQNLNASSEIGTLFLDGDLRIRMFTPPVAGVINLTAFDVGRPITDLTHRLDYDGLERDVRAVLGGQAPVDTEVRAVHGGWFRIRVRPYRTLEGGVEGVVVTFDDTTARKTAELALAESEAEYRALVSAGNNSFYRMSADWRLMYRLDSDTLADTPEPIAGWEDKYILADDRSLVAAAIADAIRTKSLFELEHRVRLADETVGWVLSRAVPALGPDGEIVEWFGAASDVTTRKRAEAALRESEEKYRTLFEGIVEGVYYGRAIFDEEGRCVDLFYIEENPAAIGMIGQSAKGRLLSELAPYEAYWLEIFGHTARTGESQRLERFAAPDGIWYDFHVFKPESAGENEFAVIFSDVTARHQAEAELRESEARQRLMLELVPALLWQADPVGAVASVSESWATYTGQSSDEVNDFGWLDAIHPEDLPATRAAFEHAFATGEPIERQQRIRKAGNGYRWHVVRHVPVRDEHGAIVRWFGAAVEVDELHGLQERQRVLLLELQHRVRNTLAVVRSLSKSTAETSDSVEDFAAHFEGRLNALARTQMVLTRAPGEGVDLETLVREELLAHAPDAARVDVEGPPVLLSAKAAEVLAPAVHELATNAVKYGALSAPQGRVAVRWETAEERGERWLRLEWKESGVRVVAAAPRREGFGTELVTQRVPYELRGRGSLDLRPGGLHARIAFPVRSGESILQTDAPGD